MNFIGPCFEGKKMEIKTINSSNSLRYIDEDLLVNKVLHISPMAAQTENPEIRKPWKMGKLISTLYLVLNFLMKLKEVSGLRKPRWLKDIHFELIGDKSFFPKVYKKYSIIKRGDSLFNIIDNVSAENEKTSLKIRFQRFLKKNVDSLIQMYSIIDPSTKKIVLFDGFHLLMILYFFITIPLNIAFDFNPSNYFEGSILSYVFLELFFLFFFLFDIVLNFRKGYYKKGKLVTNKKKVFYHYAKKDFFFDFFSILFLFFEIFMIIFEYKTGVLSFNIVRKVLSSFFFVRIRNFQKIFDEIEEYLFLDESWSSLFSLFNLLYRTTLVLHILSCVWFFIGNYELSTGNSWLKTYNLENEIWYIKYLHSVYFIVITMNTVGFGDISPSTNKEKLFTIFLVYFACGFFAYSINSIGNIINEITKIKSEFKKKVNIINGYMRKKDITYTLRKKVRKYLEFFWLEENSQNTIYEQEIINSLSESLKEKLVLEANGRILKSMKMFTNNFSEEVLKRSAFCFKEKRFTPGEIVFSRNDYLEKAIYFVKKGEIEISSEKNANNNNSFKLKISKNQNFGEISFFSNQARNFSAISTDYTTVFFLSREDFTNILKNFPEDNERFMAISSSVDLNKDFSLLQIKCKSCGKNNHTINECKWLHSQFMKEIIVAKASHSLPHSRSKVNKDTKRKLSRFTLKKIKIIVSGANFITQLLDESFISQQLEKIDFENLEFNLQNQVPIQNETQAENEEGSNLIRTDSHSSIVPTNVFERECDEQNLNIDQVQEYTEFYPMFNISSVLPLFNVRNVTKKSKRRTYKKTLELCLKQDQFLKTTRNFETQRSNFFHTRFDKSRRSFHFLIKQKHLQSVASFGKDFFKNIRHLIKKFQKAFSQKK